MSFVLVFTESYNRLAARWLKKHPDLRSQYLKTLQLLELDPFHPSLRLHALSGRLQGVYSVSINLSYRMTLELLIDENEIVLLNIGDHDTVYKPTKISR
jgi:mRNA-degrading endonuclease YafQ of YafQ-DinJ toxin-antitoxin module